MFVTTPPKPLLLSSSIVDSDTPKVHMDGEVRRGRPLRQQHSPTSPRYDSSLAYYPSTIDETEVETALYFPTFARRGSSPRSEQQQQVSPQRQQQQHRVRERSKGARDRRDVDSHRRTSLLIPEAAVQEGDEEEDHIFDFETEDDDTSSSTPLQRSGSDSSYVEVQDRVGLVRRAREYSNSSSSTKDLHMVWDEEDGESSEDAELESLQSPTNLVTHYRHHVQQPRHHRHSSISSSSSVTKPPIVSPKWSSNMTGFQSTAVSAKPATTITIPSLPFARKVRRPSESIVSPRSNHWHSFSRSNTLVNSLGPADVANVPSRRLSDEHLEERKQQQQQTHLETGVRGAASPCNPIVSRRGSYQGRSNTHLAAKGEAFGRKRSMTDPLLETWNRQLSFHELSKEGHQTPRQRLQQRVASTG
jgi:hypothetical protein